MNKEKLNHLWKMMGYTPRAAIELALVGSVPLGILTASIGAGVAYLSGNHELVGDLVKIGGLSALAGASATYVYSYAAFTIKSIGPIGEIEIMDDAIALVAVLDHYKKFNELEKKVEIAQ